MIDIHTHILPEMDDGAHSWEEAIEMAELAAESGTHTLAATVHANLPGMDNERRMEVYVRQIEHFRTILHSEGIALNVCSGMEVFAYGDFTRKLHPGDFLTLNGSRYLLTEFPMDERAAQIYRTVDDILESGLIPVLAHPERYACVQRVPAHVWEWYQMGALIQINKGSLLGRFGSRIQRTADALIHYCLASVVASDAHHADVRTPDLTKTEEFLKNEYGSRTAYLLLEENPRRILQGRETIRKEAIPYRYGEGNISSDFV